MKTVGWIYLCRSQAVAERNDDLISSAILGNFGLDVHVIHKMSIHLDKVKKILNKTKII